MTLQTSSEGPIEVVTEQRENDVRSQPRGAGLNRNATADFHRFAGSQDIGEVYQSIHMSDHQ
jgi:hypothetical protein